MHNYYIYKIILKINKEETKKMNKVLAILISIVLCTSFALGCNNEGDTDKDSGSENNNSSNEETPKSDVTLTHINTKVDSRDFFVQFFEDFESETGIKIEYDVMAAAQYGSVITTRLSSGDAPDTFQVFPGVGNAGIVTYAEQGFTLDLTGESFLDNILPGVLEALAVDGKQYALPTSQNIIAVEYNKKLFAQAGIEKNPTSLQEFYEVCQKLLDAGITPYAMEGKTGWFFETFAILPTTLYSVMPDFNSKRAADEAKFNDTGWRKVFEIMMDMSDKGFFQEQPLGYGYDEANNLFTSGQAAMRCNGNWAFSDFQTKGGDDFEFGAFFFPANEAGVNEPQYCSLLAEMFSISAATENVEESKRLLKYFNENNDILLIEYNGLPVIQGATVEKPSLAITELMPFINSLNGMDPTLGVPAGFNELFMKLQQEVIAGRKSIDAVLDELDEFYDEQEG